MPAKGEAKTGPSPFFENVVGHLDSVSPLMRSTERNKEIVGETRRLLSKLPQQDVTKFFESTLSDAIEISPHLGNNDVKRHGFTFGVLTSDNNFLIRLYVPTGINSDKVQKQLRHVKNSGLEVFSSWLQHNADTYMWRKPTGQTHFFAGAEIMTRTLLHVKLKNRKLAQPLPIALIGKEGEPIGFALQFDSTPSASKDARLEKVDAFFDWEDTYGLGKEHTPARALTIYRALKQINCILYAESDKDLKRMMIYDENNKFITFNRVGYSTDEMR